jgi:hypothetical protein
LGGALALLALLALMLRLTVSAAPAAEAPVAALRRGRTVRDRALISASGNLAGASISAQIGRRP